MGAIPSIRSVMSAVGDGTTDGVSADLSVSMTTTQRIKLRWKIIPTTAQCHAVKRDHPARSSDQAFDADAFMATPQWDTRLSSSPDSFVRESAPCRGTSSRHWVRSAKKAFIGRTLSRAPAGTDQIRMQLRFLCSPILRIDAPAASTAAYGPWAMLTTYCLSLCKNLVIFFGLDRNYKAKTYNLLGVKSCL